MYPADCWISDHARQFSNQCDINKVVYENWSDGHCNQSDTQLSALVLELYYY